MSYLHLIEVIEQLSPTCHDWFRCAYSKSSWNHHGITTLAVSSVRAMKRIYHSFGPPLLSRVYHLAFNNIKFEDEKERGRMHQLRTITWDEMDDILDTCLVENNRLQSLVLKEAEYYCPWGMLQDYDDGVSPITS